jgi:hypothetical protein
MLPISVIHESLVLPKTEKKAAPDLYPNSWFISFAESNNTKEMMEVSHNILSYIALLNI